MPRGTTRIAVSPTNRPGRFGFVVESVRRRWWPSVVADGLRRNPRSARSALLTKLIGWAPESDVNLAWATGSTPIADVERWRRAGERAPAFDKLDKPRFDWAGGAPVRVVILEGASDAVAKTRASLKGQFYARWSVVDAALLDDADGSITCVLEPGDRLMPTALAQVAEHVHRHPGAALLHGDLLVDGADGCVPDFRPGWSPMLAQGLSGFDKGVFVRGLDRWTDLDRRAFLTTGRLPRDAVASLRASDIVALRRFVLRVSRAVVREPRPPMPPPRMPDVVASIVIPSRDHPALLRRVVASIRERSEAGRYEIVVVDNGSTSAEAKALNAELARADDVMVLDHPGAFNFSSMCNDAVARARGDVLVFLNDDTEVLSENWLSRLCAHALDPSTGAVGAKLTYPDGRIQHVGVLLGMGGSAGHFGSLAPGDDPGWAMRNLVAHEVSAVTGACLAVERRKFEAVDGFDAARLPIELSDVDLCLKLGDRGWRTVVDPAIHLMHEESVSRGGATLRRLDVHGGEREIFIARWAHVLRDDPTFHPGLSLYRWRAALG